MVKKTKQVVVSVVCGLIDAARAIGRAPADKYRALASACDAIEKRIQADKAVSIAEWFEGQAKLLWAAGPQYRGLIVSRPAGSEVKLGDTMRKYYSRLSKSGGVRELVASWKGEPTIEQLDTVADVLGGYAHGTSITRRTRYTDEAGNPLPEAVIAEKQHAAKVDRVAQLFAADKDQLSATLIAVFDRALAHGVTLSQLDKACDDALANATAKAKAIADGVAKKSAGKKSAGKGALVKA